MDSYSPDALTRLGRAVRDRRLELDCTQARIHALGGPSVGVLSKIETGARLYGDKVMVKLERVLGWERGSVEAILEGDEPTVRTDAAQPAHDAPAAVAGAYPDFVGDDGFFQHIWDYASAPEDEREFAILRIQLRRAQRGQRQAVQGEVVPPVERSK